ncbi:MAG: hypothetical protein K2P90_04165 [Holosporales bacterium]|nr:hypothetical protein [Holosporales bacterium]
MRQGFKFFTRQEIILFLWGALSGLAFAPFHAWFLLMFGISGLSYFLNDEENRGKAFKLVWFWSFGLFLISLHWISFSLGIDLEKFFWLLPLTILGLPAFLALIPAFFCGPFLLFFSPGVGRWLGFAALWGISLESDRLYMGQYAGIFSNPLLLGALWTERGERLTLDIPLSSLEKTALLESKTFMEQCVHLKSFCDDFLGIFTHLSSSNDRGMLDAACPTKRDTTAQMEPRLSRPTYGRSF